MTDLEELNDQVVRKLGWEWKYNEIRKEWMYYRERKDRYNGKPLREWRLKGMCNINGEFSGEENYCPRYVEDIQAAWEIVEHLRRKIKSTKGRKMNRTTLIQTSSNSRKFRVYINGKVGIADTAPIAICKSFLMVS